MKSESHKILAVVIAEVNVSGKCNFQPLKEVSKFGRFGFCQWRMTEIHVFFFWHKITKIQPYVILLYWWHTFSALLTGQIL
jgi:hypothetical protein